MCDVLIKFGVIAGSTVIFGSVMSDLHSNHRLVLSKALYQSYILSSASSFCEFATHNNLFQSLFTAVHREQLGIHGELD